MDHLYLRGKLREIAVLGLIKPWLTSKFATGSGKITDCNGKLSSEIDVLIYANDVIPPVVYSDDGFGLYPCESCIATIEVKSKLTVKELKSALKSSALISPSHMEFQSGRLDETGTKTISHGFLETGRCLFAFSSNLSGRKTELDRYLKYADPLNHKRLDIICVVGAGCWVNKRLENGENEWVLFPATDNFDEVIAFCSVLSSSLIRIY